MLGGGAREGYVFRNRGVVYGDGVIYTAGGSFLFALDAKPALPLPGFGKNGQASVILDVLSQRYADVKTAISMGYWFTTAPQFWGVLYIGSTRSEKATFPVVMCLRRRREDRQGALALQHDSAGRERSGWDVAGPTWVGGERNGGGIWETMAIDPDLGMLYAAVANPFGDSTKARARISLPIRSLRSRWLTEN